MAGSASPSGCPATPIKSSFAAPARGAAFFLCLLLRLVEGQGPDQVPASRAHGVILLRRPVVPVEQIVHQLQLRVPALL